MPKVKLSGAFENLTGLMGRFEFKDGVSVNNIALEDAEKMGASMLIYDAATGKQISRVLRFSESQNIPYVSKNQAPEKEKPKPKVEKEKPKPDYTREQLEEIADTKGLRGIRAFAEKYDVRGTSIIGIIDDLMLKVPK